MPTSDLKLRVFLCHASQDRPSVRDLYQRLLVESWIDPWLDQEKLLPGQEWKQEIEKSVEDVDVVIVCLSRSSVEKEGYYQKEIKKVLDVADQKPAGTIFIIPLRLDDCSVPRYLAKLHYEDFFPAGQREQACERILQSLGTRFAQVKSRTDNAQKEYSRFNSVSGWDEKWLEKHRSNALKGLKKNGFSGFLEVKFTLSNQNLNIPQKDLLSAARQAQIHTFGWPIGIVLDSPGHNPKPQADGIMAEIEFRNLQWNGGLLNTYDYWALRNNGDFYLLKSLFEDDGTKWVRGTVISFNTRIQRTTEILLYCGKLYSYLGVDPTATIMVSIKLGGLKDRQLSSTRSFISRGKLVCIESEIEKTVQVVLSDLKLNLVSLVKECTQPLFLLFDFQEFADSVYEDIVNNYANGKVV